MRLKISLSAPEKHLKIPYNYNHVLSAIVYNKIVDLDMAQELHESTNYKFFTFSQLFVSKRKNLKDFMISRNGKFSFFISSPNDELIKSMVEGYLDIPSVNFMGQNLLVEQVELLKMPEIKKRMKMKTLSPLIARVQKEVEGKLKIWDLNPNDLKFYENLQNNLLNKYNSFYDGYDGDNYVKIVPKIDSIKRKRITIPKRDQETFHRCFLMKFEIEADKRLVKFAYDCGLGEKNSMGFGCVDAKVGGK
ncbi:CRISPR-associated endoribonuclease Cas6 [Methanobacterium alcaliphilum]|uniref:CRISPR-associated endoribonuclease Cas6 n=1 Tax=Methanobacterium alcaliphilum TaxID=392018 RepID=UPI00200AB49E|nr:CRISPR-associated endoribonuclease Cas6 [Methanobacterium alcaliphilum]MCK9150528.1 CRISPR-associated endoribonuclease Cas6 [Methanobacterium alcaliphilum]